MLEGHLEISVHPLVKVVELDDKVPQTIVGVVGSIGAYLDPFLDLFEFFFGKVVCMIFLPFLIRRHQFDFILVQGRYLDIKALHFSWEWPEADGVEIKRLLSHVFKHPVE